MKSSFAKFGLTVAASLSMGLVACSDTETNPPNGNSAGGSSVAIDQAAQPEPVASAPRIEDVAELLVSGDRDEALRVAELVLAPLSASEHNALLDAYFLATSEKKNNDVAIVLAESIISLTPENGKAAYIAGLAYWNAITVEKDAAIMAKYWDVEALYSNKAVQTRLAEAYADTDSSIYDPAKAAEALARIQ